MNNAGSGLRPGPGERCKRSKLLVLAGLTAAGLLAFVVGSQPEEPPLRFAFEEGAEGWVAIPPPTGVVGAVAGTANAGGAKVGQRALRVQYRIQQNKLGGVLRSVEGLAGAGVRVWLKTDSAAVLVLGLAERDGSSYQHVIRTRPGEWQQVTTPFAAFSLSDDAKDENGRLDPAEVNALIIADAGGFLPGAHGERTLWVDEYEVVAEMPGMESKPYIPLLTTGHPSASDARATVGITYRPGRSGLGVLTDAPGEMVVVAAKGLRREAGTVEMWLCPQFAMENVQDFAGLLTMQSEPFIVGFRGSLLLFYTESRQIAFLLNADLERILATSPLNWQAGEWHHLAASWGQRGMRLYLDGRVVAENRFTGGPGLLCRDVVVGNQAWPIASQRFANTVIDELRLSSVQRPDEDIAAAAGADQPLEADEHTVALEHLDGLPLPPITLAASGTWFHARPVGKPVELTAVMAGELPPDCRLLYTVSTPGGVIVQEGAQSVAEPEDAPARASLTVPALSSPGFYRLDFSLQRGQEVLNEGTDWFRVTGPAPPRGRTSLLFGASGCYTDPHAHEEFFRRAGACGVRSLRMPFEWAEIEPQDDRFVWDKYDRIVAWADKYAVELVPTFIWEKPQPAWAGRGQAKEGLEQERYPPEDLAKWQDFVFHVVERYKDSVEWWIPANEPNLPKYWHPEPDAKAYVALLRATREAAHRADPKAKILGCNVAGMDLGFLEECFKEGALDYCEAVGAHPYICPHSPDERIPINILDPGSPIGTFREGLLAGRALIERYGGHQKLWLDEAGQPYRDDFIAPDWGVPEGTAAAYLVKIYAEALASGAVERVLWFSFWGGEYGSFALLRPNGSPTLPLIAYVACCERLDGASLVGEDTRGEGVRALVFRRGEQQVEVLWCPQGEREVALRDGEQAFDMYGFPLEQANRGRRVSVTATPMFVTMPTTK